jgi:hypothetical protein
MGIRSRQLLQAHEAHDTSVSRIQNIYEKSRAGFYVYPQCGRRNIKSPHACVYVLSYCNPSSRLLYEIEFMQKYRLESKRNDRSKFDSLICCEVDTDSSEMTSPQIECDS